MSTSSLHDAFELALVGSEFVINRYRDASQNLRTTMLKILRRAGLEPWERVFQNFSASRQTELKQQHPAHVACDWMSNSEAVANQHDLHTTEAGFDGALSTTCIALQNPVQCLTRSGRNAPQGVLVSSTIPAEVSEVRDASSGYETDIYPTRIRTWTNRTKICCATVTLSGTENGAGV